MENEIYIYISNERENKNHFSPVVLVKSVNLYDFITNNDNQSYASSLIISTTPT